MARQDLTEIKTADNDNEEQSIDPLVETIVPVSTNEPVKITPTPAQRFSGIIYALVASLCFTISVFIPKQLNVDLIDAFTVRFLIQSIIMAIYMKSIKHYSFYEKKSKQELFILFWQVFFLTSGYFAFLIAYRYLPLPDVTTIRYTQVMWAAIISAIIYREKPSIAIILAVLLTMVGVTFVAQPEFLFKKTSDTSKQSISSNYQRHLLGLFFALYCSIAMTLMIILNKILLLKYNTKHSLIMLQFAVTSLLISLMHLFYKYYFITDKIQTLKNDFLNWRYLFVLFACILQIIASITTQKAIKREHPSILTIIQSSDILIAAVLQNIFTPIKSNLLSIIGSILVLTSIIIISVYKFINDKKQKSSNK